MVSTANAGWNKLIPMRTTVIALALVCGLAACRKKGGDPGPGPGGGWLVGERGMMINVHADGSFSDYELETEDDLLDIACRGADSAFVVGAGGTFLRTFDGGVEWEAVDLGTRGVLRSVAAASREYVVAAGDDGLFLSADSGTTWSTLATGSFSSVAIDHTGDVIMALDRSGTVWREDRASSLRPVFASSGAVALSMSHAGDKAVVMVPGQTLWSSESGGASWRPLDLGGSYDLRNAWVSRDGDVLAVGVGGVVVRIDSSNEVLAQHPGLSDLEAIHLGGSGTGYAGGADGRVLQTSDEGVTWTQMDRTVPQRILGIDQIDPIGHY
jgi:Photosynthesis system II assembly factor YCF48